MISIGFSTAGKHQHEGPEGARTLSSSMPQITSFGNFGRVDSSLGVYDNEINIVLSNFVYLGNDDGAAVSENMLGL